MCIDLKQTFLNAEAIITLTKQDDRKKNKLGLSCAKLRTAWASYQIALVRLAYTEAAYYA